MNREDAVRRLLFVEGLEDYIGLWVVADGLRGSREENPGDSARFATLEFLRPLLEDGYVKAGDHFGDGKFHPWSMTPAEGLARIDREWQALGREPTLWEICWFSLTEKGEALARTLK